MKTSEFIKKVEKLEFVSEVEEGIFGENQHFGKGLLLKNEKGQSISIISIQFEYLVDNRFYSYVLLDSNQRKQLFNLLTKYAATPIAERKDKTIEDKAREYIQECVNENLDFYSCVDNLEYNARRTEGTRENEIYVYYVNHSNKFVKMWCEVAANE